MMVSLESSPRKSTYLPRQQKLCAIDGRSDGKAHFNFGPLAKRVRVAC